MDIPNVKRLSAARKKVAATLVEVMYAVTLPGGLPPEKAADLEARIVNALRRYEKTQGVS